MSTSRRFHLTVAVTAALVAASVGASTGLAGSPPGGMSPLATRAHNSYFAGRSYPEAGRASVTVLFVVPRLSCTNANTGVASGSFLYTAAGSSGRGSGRTVVSAASVQLFCLRSEPAPLPVVELKGHQTYGRKRPHIGDLMKATVIDSAGLLSVTLEDLTKHHTFTLSRSTTAAPATAAEIGDEALKGVPSLTPGPVYPITNFGAIHFAAGRINGKPLGAAGGRAFDMVGRGRVVQIRTGRLTGRSPSRSRAAFTTRWEHS